MDPNLKYLLEKVDHLVESNADNQRNNADKLEKILVQATKTNGRVTALEGKLAHSDQEIKELKFEIKDLKEDNHFNKGKAKITNTVLGGVWGAVLVLLGLFSKYIIGIFKHV